MKKNVIRIVILVVLSSLISFSFVSALSISITQPTTSYVVYSESGIMCSANVQNANGSPSISYDGTYLGSMTSGGYNWYYFNWHPTSSQRGLGTQGRKWLKVSSGSSSALKSIYVSEYTASIYNDIATNWTIVGAADTDYNCFAYALGITNENLWPWKNWLGEYPPTVSELDTEMNSRGYTRTYSASQADVVAYYDIDYPNSRIGHFARGYGSAFRSKWGKIEVMQTSIDPYKSNGAYGSVAAYYKKN